MGCYIERYQWTCWTGYDFLTVLINSYFLLAVCSNYFFAALGDGGHLLPSVSPDLAKLWKSFSWNGTRVFVFLYGYCHPEYTTYIWALLTWPLQLRVGMAAHLVKAITILCGSTAPRSGGKCFTSHKLWKPNNCKGYSNMVLPLESYKWEEREAHVKSKGYSSSTTVHAYT